MVPSNFISSRSCEADVGQNFRNVLDTAPFKSLYMQVERFAVKSQHMSNGVGRMNMHEPSQAAPDEWLEEELPDKPRVTENAVQVSTCQHHEISCTFFWKGAVVLLLVWPWVFLPGGLCRWFACICARRLRTPFASQRG